MEIRNAAALITGGSQGLGRALGQALAGAGARVVLVARHSDVLDKAVQEIRSIGGEAYGIAADIGEKTAVHAIAGEAAIAGRLPIAIPGGNGTLAGRRRKQGGDSHRNPTVSGVCFLRCSQVHLLGTGRRHSPSASGAGRSGSTAPSPSRQNVLFPPGGHSSLMGTAGQVRFSGEGRSVARRP